MTNIEKICNRVIEISYYLLFFLTPLIFLPFSYELFEFNKMIFVYFLTGMIVSAWAIKSVINGKLIFKRTFWDFPLLFFLTSQFLSFLLSIDRHTSFFGYYSRFNGGLLSSICYALLYWAFVSNAKGINGACHPEESSTKDPLQGKIKRWGFFASLRMTGTIESSRAKSRDLLGQLKISRLATLARNDRIFMNSFSEKCLNLLLLSAGIVAFYGVLEHFGIDAKYWVQDVQNRVFSTLGQPNWLATWLVGIIPLTWWKILGSENLRAFHLPGASAHLEGGNKNPKLQIFKNLQFNTSYILRLTSYILLFSCLLFTKSRSGFLGFIGSYIVFWSIFYIHQLLPTRQAIAGRVGNNLRYLQCLRQALIVSGLTLIASLTFGTPYSSSLKDIITRPTANSQQPTAIPTGGTESGEIRKIVWKGAVDIWQHYPVLGTGPETFAYSYYWFRPREHNDTSEWDFVYNKAHNEYLNFAATTGTVGLAAYMLLIITYLIGVIGKIKEHLTSYILPITFLSSFAGILISNFFGFSVVAVNLLFFLLPALTAAFSVNSPSRSQGSPGRCLGLQTISHQTSHSPNLIRRVIIAGIFLSLISYLLSLSRYWLADFHFAKADKLEEDDPAAAYLEINNAIKLNSEPLYFSLRGRLGSELAYSAFIDEDSAASAQFAAQSIIDSNKALKTSPFNVNLWKERVRIYYELAQVDKKYYSGAIESLLAAADLAKTDAKIQYNLGVLYLLTSKKDLAVTALEKAVKLKPNYEDPRLILAEMYKQTGKKDMAAEQLKYILEKIDPESKEAKQALDKLF